MTLRCGCLYLVIPVLLWCAAAADAQERRGAIYVVGGISAARQSGPDGESRETYVTAPGGTTHSWFVGGGVFVTPRVGIDVDSWTTGTMSAREPSRYGQTYNEERRDRFLTVAARFSVAVRRRIRLEPIAGLTVTTPEASSQTDYDPSVVGASGSIVKGPRIYHRLDSTWGPVVGCDVRVGTARIALLPSIRFVDTHVSHGFYDESSPRREIEAIYPGGYPSMTIRVGIGLRADF